MENLQRLIREAIGSKDIAKLLELKDTRKEDEVPFLLSEQDLLNKGLYEATYIGDVKLVQILVQKGASVNYTDGFKQSVLNIASGFSTGVNSEEIIRFFIDSGSDVNHRNINGQSDFMHVFSSGKLPYVYFVDKLSSVNDIHERDLRTGGTFLHILCSRSLDDYTRVNLIRELIKRGVSVHSIDNNDDTPLHIVANIACKKSIEILLDNGADIQARNRFGESVLHCLASSNEFEGFEESLLLLLDRGIDINDLDSEGRNAIHHALMSKDTDRKAIEVLLTRGIRINVMDRTGRNEIFHAVKHFNILEFDEEDIDRRVDVIKYLSELGVDVSRSDMYGITPLHEATLKNNLDVLLVLLESGADVAKQTKTGATPLHWACKIYNMAHLVLYFCIKNDADINVKDINGCTPLHWAVWFRQASVAQTLLQAGCDHTIEDGNRETSSVLAQKMHFDDFGKLLEDNLYKRLEELNLEYPVPKCIERDPVLACPLLRYIKKANNTLSIEEYINHLDIHCSSLRELVDIVISRDDMGYYYEIEENQSVAKMIDSLMTMTATRVAQSNPLFRCELRCVGSVYEGTKVKLPEEFDYLWCLQEFEKAFFPVTPSNCPAGFAKLQLRQTAEKSLFAKYCSDEGFLDSKSLMRNFYGSINCEIFNILSNEELSNQFRNVVCVKFLDEILCSTSSLKFFFFGRQAKLLLVSIDIVPSLFFPGWIPETLFKDSLDLYPMNNSLPVFSVVVVTPDRCHVKDFTLFYRISYTYLEQTTVRNIPKHLKKGYIILKALIESGYFPRVVDHDNDRAVKKYISSYLLKTCFLHEMQSVIRETREMENIENEKENKKTSIDVANRVVLRLEKYIKEKSVPSYFNRGQNLLGLEGMSDGIREQGIYLQLIDLLKYMLRITASDDEAVNNRVHVMYSRI